MRMLMSRQSQAAERTQAALHAAHSVRCGERKHRDHIFRFSGGGNVIRVCLCSPRAGLALVTCYAPLNHFLMHCRGPTQQFHASDR